MKTQLDNEVSLISNKIIKDFTKNILNSLPEYFWKIPASSTGKYHPNYALGESGLIRHIIASIRIASHIFTITPSSSLDKDVILSALILHDGLKHGLDYNEFSLHDHPVIMADYVQNFKDDFIGNLTRSNIANAIASHMGKWNTSERSNTILPLPFTDVQKAVHLCDYLASRKDIEFVF